MNSISRAALLALALAALFAGALLWSPLASAAGATATSPASQVQDEAECLTCHEMESQVSAWHASSHKDVDCLSCHSDPGPAGWWQRLNDMVRRRYTHRFGDSDVTNLSAAVPDARCLRCHGDQMPYVMEDYDPPVPGPDGQVPRVAPDQLIRLPLQPEHDLHLSQVEGITCTSCHNQVGHRIGGVSAEAAASNASYAQLNHETCDTCHRARQVRLATSSSLTCAACHLNTSQLAPADHGTGWRDAHGDAAAAGGAGCASCHISGDLPAVQGASCSVSTAPPQSLWGSTAWRRPQLEGEREDPCQQCHAIPMPHPNSFMKDHGEAYQADPELCARCHLTDDQEFDLTLRGDATGLVRAPACLNCHISRNPHPASAAVVDASALAKVRVEQHPRALPSSPSCQTCHAGREYVCATCHQGPEWHPEGWAARHREATWQEGLTSCRTCHAEKDACASCHH